MLVPRTVFGLARLTDDGDSRYTGMAGVKLERDRDGKPYAIATDGHKMAVFTWNEGNGAADCYPAIDGAARSPAAAAGFETILSAEACQQAARLAKPRARFAASKPLIAGNVLIDEPACNGKIPIVATDLENTARIEPRAVEGRFPRWRDVFPAYNRENSLSISIDPRYLAEVLAAVAEFASDSDARAVTLTIAAREANGKNCQHYEKPLIVSAERADGRMATGIVMPLATDRHGRRSNSLNDGEPVPVFVGRRNTLGQQPAAEDQAEDRPPVSPAQPEPPQSLPPAAVSQPAAPPAPLAASPAVADLSAEWAGAVGLPVKPVTQPAATAKQPAAIAQQPANSPPAAKATRQPRRSRAAKQAAGELQQPADLKDDGRDWLRLASRLHV